MYVNLTKLKANNFHYILSINILSFASVEFKLDFKYSEKIYILTAN